MLRIFLVSLLAISALSQQRDLKIEAAPRRKALLIGNNKYPKQPLANAVNDATDLSATLRNAGFEAELLVDADLRTMDLSVQRFVQRLNPGDVALFYFSGHGVSIEGENFLLPVSFAAEMEADVRYQAYSAARVRDLIRSRNVRLSVLVLDACRSNPFRGSRSSGGGLSGMSGAGAFIAFAADEGRTADDNPKERNGLFTKHLLKEALTPGLGLESLFTRVRSKVYEESQGKQTPFSYSGLLGDFYFVPAAAPPAPPPTAPPPAPEPVVPKTPLPSFGEKRLHPKDGLRYVYIPPGRSIIGCYPAATCQVEDLPGREVQTSTGFWMGETEVTREAYEKVIGPPPPLRSSTHLKMLPVLQARLPVTDITAAQAQQYCTQISLRLPTEFEWEFAARAGTPSSQPQPMDAYAWLAPDGTTSINELLRSGAATHAVAQKQPNLWGLYDMLGNVAEFTMASEDQKRISIRGGSFVQTADKIRYSRRYLLPEGDATYMNFGFRCAGPSL
jgi:formylglycine-generating enzyme required for sulfatase activity